LHAQPSLIGALREGTEACLAGALASVLASPARVVVASEGNRLDGTYGAALGVRYREGNELETVRVRVVVSLVGTRRVQQRRDRVRTGRACAACTRGCAR
jgi:hypothetical protein